MAQFGCSGYWIDLVAQHPIMPRLSGSSYAAWTTHEPSRWFRLGGSLPERTRLLPRLREESRSLPWLSSQGRPPLRAGRPFLDPPLKMVGQPRQGGRLDVSAGAAGETWRRLGSGGRGGQVRRCAGKRVAVASRSRRVEERWGAEQVGVDIEDSRAVGSAKASVVGFRIDRVRRS